MKIEIFDEYRDIDRLDNILSDIWDYNSKLITPNNIDKIVSLLKENMELRTRIIELERKISKLIGAS